MKKAWLLAYVAAIIIAGCASDTSSDKAESRVYRKNSKQIDEASLNFYSLPSPLEIAYSINRTGIEYSPEMLHNPDISGRYSTVKAMALNLGIYGADLSYSLYFNKQQVAVRYMGAVKSLAGNLDISDLLSQERLKTFEDNLQDKEMLKKLVSQTFFHSDAFLKESNRSETAAMIMVGGWIESLYIACRLSGSKSDSNAELTGSIIEQSLVAQTTAGLLKTFNSKDIAYLTADVNKLILLFAAADKTKEKSIDNLPDNDSFSKLCSGVEEIRSRYTQLF